MAFAELTTRYWGTIHRIGRNLLDNFSAAGDLTEETFLTALHSPESFPGDVPFRISLYRAALMHALARMRSGSSSDADFVAEHLPKFGAERRLASPGTDWSEDGEAAFPGSHVTQRIRETLQRLDVLDRAAFLLRVVEDLPVEEAAAVLAISPRSVRQRVHRATLVLSRSLERLLETPGGRAANGSGVPLN